MLYSVKTSTTLVPGAPSFTDEAIVALAPPWPRRSVPAAFMVAECEASSTFSISSVPT